MHFMPAMYPESMPQQFLRSFKLYIHSLFHVFGLALILSVIAFIPRFIMLATNQDIFFTTDFFAPQKLWLFLVEISCLIFFLSLLWRIRCFIATIHETLLNDFKRALKKIIPVIVAGFIQGFSIVLINFASFGLYLLLIHEGLSMDKPLLYLLISILFTLQLAAAIYIYFLFCFYLPLILAEGKSILMSLKESVLLVWKNWWRTFFVQLFPWACYLIVLLIIKNMIPVPVHIYFTEPKFITFYSVLLQILLFALFIPWPAAALLVQLHDLELRKKLNRSV
ncbi:MAG: hypothetical protein ACD_60C00090G0030 [uncultured bacterium]|nr:MAG: hypothetical protein ACD_60C00090G0030 [uncultured bacterium]